MALLQINQIWLLHALFEACKGWFFAPPLSHVIESSYPWVMDKLRLSTRLSSLKPSATVAVANRAKQLRKEGVDVLSFAAGEPDFDTPVQIKQAAIEALNAGQTRYMQTLGDVDTRQAIADKLAHENNIEGLTYEHVGISAGGKHALFVALHCLIDPPVHNQPPQEVVLPVPAWVSYEPIAKLAGAKVVQVQASPDNDFRITPDQLKAAINERTRLIIFNSPSNPCGTMYSPDELRDLAQVIHEAAISIAPNLLVLTDEIYEKIIYGDIEHLSLGSIKSIAERTITINGLSKCCAMTGWRVGYTACPGEFGKKFIKSMGTLQGQMTTNITSFVYPAIRVALTQCRDDIEQMRRAYAQRATLICDRLSAIPGFQACKPTGAFYVFPRVADLFGSTTPRGTQISSAMSLAEALLEEAKIAVVPGEDFGGCSFEHIRISFACSEEHINQGMDRLAAFVDSLKQ